MTSSVNPSVQQNKTSTHSVQIRIRGKNYVVPSATLGDRLIVITGRFPRLASLRDEEFVEGDLVAEPEAFMATLKQAGPHADVFTFSQKLPDASPKYDWHWEPDNVAAIAVSSYSDWWNNQIAAKLRRNLRRSLRNGISVERVEPNDEFVRDLLRIYNETPVRQGRRFWHYQKSFDTVKEEILTYLERSLFLGAFWNGQMVGFMKIVPVDRTARMMHILTMLSHTDKTPATALIAKAVEICEEEGYTHLIYGKYVYGKSDTTSLIDFKNRNGFSQFILPRYFIPLTRRGQVALRLGLHRGVKNALPKCAVRLLVRTRAQYYRFFRTQGAPHRNAESGPDDQG